MRHHSQDETLLVTRANCTEVLKIVLNWLMEAANLAPAASPKIPPTYARPDSANVGLAKRTEASIMLHYE